MPWQQHEFMFSNHPVVANFSGGPADVLEAAAVHGANHREDVGEYLPLFTWTIVPGYPRRYLVQDYATFNAEYVGHASEPMAVVVANGRSGLVQRLDYRP